jgi:hypothetical protein
MDAQARRPTPATHLLAICALLLAVFAMHGGPAGTIGCHSAMPLTAAPMASTHHAALTANGTSGGSATVRAAATAGAGTLCVSTPGRAGITLHHLPSLAWTVALAAFAATPVRKRPPGSAGTRRRGPPGSGQDLLLQECIART